MMISFLIFILSEIPIISLVLGGLFVPVSPTKARSGPGAIPEGKGSCSPWSWLMKV